MTAPGTILVAKMLVPETEVPATAGTVHMPPNEEHKNENFIGAIARGTIDGGQLAFNVAIMLISFVALVGLFNAIMLGISNFALGARPHPLPALAQQRPRRRRRARRLAHRHPLARLPAPSATCSAPAPSSTSSSPSPSSASCKATLDPRTFSIATFALCGFANVGSIGMQIGGIGALVPNRRNDLAQLGLRAMLAGTMANLMSASIVSMLLK